MIRPNLRLVPARDLLDNFERAMVEMPPVPPATPAVQWTFAWRFWWTVGILCVIEAVIFYGLWRALR
jgi:hypothetical protein